MTDYELGRWGLHLTGSESSGEPATTAYGAEIRKRLRETGHTEDLAGMLRTTADHIEA